MNGSPRLRASAESFRGTCEGKYRYITPHISFLIIVLRAETDSAPGA